MPAANPSTLPRLTNNGDGTHSPSVVVQGSGPQAYTLLSAATATGAAVSGIRGGDYIWRVSGTFGGGTATLQTLDLDGATWVAVKKADGTDLSVTAATSIGVGIGQGATVRVLITGATGASLNSTLAGLS